MNITAWLAAAAFLCLPAAAFAADGAAVEVSASGFGTLAATYASERSAGAAPSRATSFKPDSKLGVELGAALTEGSGPGLSAGAQLVAQQAYANVRAPMVEWANLKYQLTPALAVRAGRIPLAVFMVSETRFVGYANPWVRPPLEVYGIDAATSHDGIDASYAWALGGTPHALSAFRGISKTRLASGGAVSSTGWGLADTLDLGDTTLRAGLASAGVGMALAGRFAPGGVSLRTLSLGASHDRGGWFAIGEWVRVDGSAFFYRSTAAYATAGLRLGPWTPYGTLAAARSAARPDPDAAAGPAGAPASAFFTLRTVTAGLRWDFAPNTAAKLQYDRVRSSAGLHGRLGSACAAYVPGGRLDVVTATVDFVF